MQAQGAGWDRRRLGARLRAALAGLQELHGLRERQQARVRGALGGQAPAPDANACAPRPQDSPLEGALSALKEQLSRLRQQDVGLKTHLEHLDQQISELQLGVSKGTCEPADSDSRPSSGFYELSDAGGSCSRSTSCTSICSEPVAPARHRLPGVEPPTTHPGQYRPRSADETTVHAVLQPPGRLPQEDSLTEVNRGTWARIRTRPVSTGDLERLVPARLGTPRRTGPEDAPPSALLRPGLRATPFELDPTYQSDLVSEHGNEVYPYPSPLHAVALQSPLFVLTKDTPQAGSRQSPRTPGPGSPGKTSVQPRPASQEHPAGATYIDKLLQRTQGRGGALRGGEAERGLPRRGESKPQGEGSGCSLDPQNGLQRLGCSQGLQEAGACTQSWGVPGRRPVHSAPVSLGDSHQSTTLQESWMPSQGCLLEKTTWDQLLLQQEPPTHSCPQARPLPPAPHCRNDVADLSFKKEDVHCGSLLTERPTHPLAAEAHPELPRAGHPGAQSRNGRHRKRGCREKPWGAPEVSWLPLAWGASPGYPGEGSPGRGTTMGPGVPGRSCSETSLYHIPFLLPLVVTQQEGGHVSTQALYPLGAIPLAMVAGSPARGVQPKWQSSGEISSRAPPAGAPTHPGLVLRRPPGRSSQGPRGRPPMSWPGPCDPSTLQPPKNSAEWGPLPPSPIAETSEDESGSDHTANRFGDGESSGLEDESSWVPSQGTARQGDLRRLSAASPEPPRVHAGPRPPRVKASRALKKKLRSLQPLSLRVLSMV
ncbi:dapper homolog 2 [Tenrec ecaudatus]|uniref:dapper homolog 2 n=1 Tax=Tenrec ecaudatus TaxID=94439 RepID=UPI003F5A5637